MLGRYHYDLESSTATNTRKFVESILLDYRVELNENVYVVFNNEPKILSAFK